MFAKPECYLALIGDVKTNAKLTNAKLCR